MTSQTPPKFRAQVVTRPRDQVEQQIREAILGGTFAQGEKLAAGDGTGSQFGVSRPTIREALGALVSAGLIRKIPGVAGGSFVNTVTPGSLSRMLSESMDTILRLGALDVAELTSVRRSAGSPCGRMGGQEPPDRRTSTTMHRSCSASATRRSTTPTSLSYDLAFHTTIGRASGNRLLAAFISAVHDSTHPAQYLKVTAEVGRHTVKQHMEILAAIEDGRRGSGSRTPWPRTWTTFSSTPAVRCTAADVWLGAPGRPLARSTSRRRPGCSGP